MPDTWKDYTDYKTKSTLAERYYAFIATCFKEGIRAVAGEEPFEQYHPFW